MAPLPFMIKKKDAAPSVHTEHRIPDQEPSGEEAGLEACANDILQAIESKDAKRLASAIKSAFELCDSYPHEEGPHVEPGEQS